MNGRNFRGMKGLASALAAALGLTLLAAGMIACGQGSIEKGLTGPVPSNPQELMAELQTQKERIDKLSDGMLERINQFNATRGPNDRKVQFSELFYTDLSPEQRDVLDQLLQQEKSPTYKNLLSRIIEDRNTIQNLQDRVLRLEQQLPDKFIIAKKGDTHFKLAHDFLIGEGATEEQAKSMLNQIDLNEDLVPGFKVWYNFDKEKSTFKTYVTQGEAGQTPLAVKRALKRKLVNERDEATARASALEQTKSQLENDIKNLEADISTLTDRRTELEGQVSDLEHRNGDLQVRGDTLQSDLEFRQNSLFFHANTEKALAQQGILSKVLKNLRDVKGITYERTLDLRQAQSITFTPETYGLNKISNVEMWPEIYQEGRDYTVAVSEDGTQATVTINDPAMFKQQRVLFAIRGEAPSS
jgi:hypothetical protein